MLNPTTGKIYESWEVVFLQSIFFEKPKGSFTSYMCCLTDLEGMEATETTKKEDDLDVNTMVEENKLAKKRDKILKQKQK